MSETEMERALRLDGEKLRAETGQHHGPWTIDDLFQSPPDPSATIVKTETVESWHPTDPTARIIMRVVHWSDGSCNRTVIAIVQGCAPWSDGDQIVREDPPRK